MPIDKGVCFCHFPSPSISSNFQERNKEAIRIPTIGDILVIMFLEILFFVVNSDMENDNFIDQWEDLLTWRGQMVQVETEKLPAVSGQISGLDADGSLIIRKEHGESVTVRFGDVRLRPLA